MTEPDARKRLVVVVGVDGSEPSLRALDAACDLIDGRVGTLEVCFVAHVAAAAEMSAEARAESLRALQAAEGDLASLVADRLRARESRFRFTRRDGPVAHELASAAEGLDRDYGGEANVVIVVGSPTQRLHHLLGSVPVALVHHARFPVVVVP